MALFGFLVLAVSAIAVLLFGLAISIAEPKFNGKISFPGLLLMVVGALALYLAATNAPFNITFCTTQ